MFPEPTILVLSLYVLQGLTSFVVGIILRNFYIRYKSDYFKYWYWSWMALVISLLGSAVALVNAFTLDNQHPFRIIVSSFTISFGLIHSFWLLAGSYEISLSRRFRIERFLAFTGMVVIVSLVLVFSFTQDPSYISERIFLRIGIKSLLESLAFITSSILVFRLRSIGTGMKMIFVSFLLYGLEQFNYFVIHLSALLGLSYGLDFPYFIGALDLFLLAMMGLGMIVSMLEVEQHNLAKANNELDTFLYRSSHDLRSPLNAISGLVGVIETEKDPEKQKEFLGMIADRVLQADEVIKDIITLRKSQKSDLNLSKVNIGEAIQKEFDALVVPTKPHPRLIIEPEESAIIKTDALMLKTVFANILSNAIKYHDYVANDARVIVKMKRKEDELKVSISDNGPGIDQKHLPKIFDMFYRANKTSLGTGLGLYLVKEVVLRLGGSIDVQSEKGRGTTFHILLKDLE
ncbi:MAG: hypothetical protein Tsb0034_17870 [Ekhidna sp.]